MFPLRRRPILGAAVVYGASRSAAKHEIAKQAERDMQTEAEIRMAEDRRQREEAERQRQQQAAIDQAVAREREQNERRRREDEERMQQLTVDSAIAKSMQQQLPPMNMHLGMQQPQPPINVNMQPPPQLGQPPMQMDVQRPVSSGGGLQAPPMSLPRSGSPASFHGATEVRYCPSCGTGCKQTDRFCAGCGYKLVHLALHEC
ncbi:hypothetical protein DM02DRAFT_361971 [Periconia macrospinosa]|uniref:Uncharacterized protein n=1 Tax=Periconia macrospinosa TaxID=97972 RepID=A0A2V1D1A5_9PLEO|nr:hypothetical protein DM02DRAFT_361971 [Periconia macrospinosa]